MQLSIISPPCFTLPNNFSVQQKFLFVVDEDCSPGILVFNLRHVTSVILRNKEGTRFKEAKKEDFE